MHPELFTIPFTELSVKSYGLMMVIGFICAIAVIKRLSKKITPDPQLIINAALYSLIAGIVGARIFYVVHYWDHFRDAPIKIFAVWQGGLELLGGVILALIVIFSYLIYHKLPIRKYLDILAIGLLIALSFGRIGCFLNGCCFGKPTSVPWAVQYPYGSLPYTNAAKPDPARNRTEPYIQLPPNYFENYTINGKNFTQLKPYEDLSPEQRAELKQGFHACVPLHPTQIYSSFNAAICAGILGLFWRRSQNAIQSGNMNKPFVKPGCTFALMFILYAPARFIIEFLRDDNPYEFDTFTISQNISIALFIFGIALMVAFQKARYIPDPEFTETKKAAI